MADDMNRLGSAAGGIDRDILSADANVRPIDEQPFHAITCQNRYTVSSQTPSETNPNAISFTCMSASFQVNDCHWPACQKR